MAIEEVSGASSSACNMDDFEQEKRSREVVWNGRDVRDNVHVHKISSEKYFTNSFSVRSSSSDLTKSVICGLEGNVHGEIGGTTDNQGNSSASGEISINIKSDDGNTSGGVSVGGTVDSGGNASGSVKGHVDFNF